jgi:predicted nucleic acid-binding protein
VGSLSLPASGCVYVDTQIIVYTVERHPDFAPLLLPLWEAVQSSRLTAITSELTILEMLVLPLRHNDHAIVKAFDEFIRQPGFSTVPITHSVLRRGAQLRSASTRLRTPDAIHAATASLNECSMLMTNDAGFRGVTEIPTLVLVDLLEQS